MGERAGKRAERGEMKMIGGLAAVTMLAVGAWTGGVWPAFAQTAAGSAPSEFSAQERERPRPRIRVQPRQPAASPYPRPGEYSWPGPGAVRVCQDWYAIEHRPSGTVATPQMRCRWVRG
jgi:hypothetical protein